MDTTVTIYTPDDGELTARFDRAMDWPTPRVGETVPLTFLFVSGTATAVPADFETLRAYGDYPGAFWSGWDEDNRYKYREQLPSGYGKSSILLGVEPSVDLTEQLVPGVWGLVGGMADRRNAALSNWRLDVELRVLARFDRYDSVSAVQAELEA